MQEKRNIRLMITLVLLTGLTGLVYWMGGKETVTVDKSIFSVEDLKSIDKVLLESPAGKVELKFNGSRWKVNEQFEADKSLIDVLFATIQKAEPKRSVTGALKDSLTTVVKQEGVKVSMFSADNVVKSFFAGGNESKTQAYFLPDGGSNNPYLMTIPGYRVYVSGIFELQETGWRDKRIFNFNWKNFKSLSASFSTNSKQNFRISFINQNFGVEGIEADTTKLDGYLDAIFSLNADQFIAPGYSRSYDSLLSTAPAILIEVQDVASRNYRLSLYAPLKSDPHVLGVLGESQGVVFLREQVAPIIKGRDYFVKP